MLYITIVLLAEVLRRIEKLKCDRNFVSIAQIIERNISCKVKVECEVEDAPDSGANTRSATSIIKGRESTKSCVNITSHADRYILAPAVWKLSESSSHALSSTKSIQIISDFANRLSRAVNVADFLQNGNMTEFLSTLLSTTHFHGLVDFNRIVEKSRTSSFYSKLFGYINSGIEDYTICPRVSCYPSQTIACFLASYSSEMRQLIAEGINLPRILVSRAKYPEELATIRRRLYSICCVNSSIVEVTEFSILDTNRLFLSIIEIEKFPLTFRSSIRYDDINLSFFVSLVVQVITDRFETLLEPISKYIDDPDRESWHLPFILVFLVYNQLQQRDYDMAMPALFLALCNCKLESSSQDGNSGIPEYSDLSEFWAKVETSIHHANLAIKSISMDIVANTSIADYSPDKSVIDKKSCFKMTVFDVSMLNFNNFLHAYNFLNLRFTRETINQDEIFQNIVSCDFFMSFPPPMALASLLKNIQKVFINTRSS